MIMADHPIMRDGLRLLVQREPGLRVVGTSNDAAQFLQDFIACKPDVTIIDCQRPRGAGVSVVNAIRAIAPQAPLVVLTNYPGEIDTSPRVGQGCILAVSKTSVSEDVMPAIWRVLQKSPRADTPR